MKSTRFRLALFGVGLVAAACAMMGCFDRVTNVDDRDQIQDNSGGSTPQATPSPGVSGPVVAVRVSTFGTETCPSGAAPANEPNSVRAGCVQPLTCTPLLAGGVPAPEGTHPAAPTLFAIVGGAESGELFAVEEPYNRDLHGLAQGTVKVRCEVGTATPGSLDVAVLP